MNTRVLFRALLWSFVAFFAWITIANWIWGPLGPKRDTATTQPADGLSPGRDGAVADADSPTGTPPATTPSSQNQKAAGAAKYRTQVAAADESFILGSVQGAQESPYRMELELLARGAAIAQVTLADFEQTVKKDDPYVLLEPVETPDGHRLTSLVLEQLAIDGVEVDLSDVVWTGRRTSADATDSVRFSTQVTDGEDRPVLDLEVEYLLPQEPAESRRFDLNVALSIVNRDDVEHEIVATIRGPVGLGRVDPRTDSRAMTVGTHTADGVRQETKLFSQVTKSGSKAFANDGGRAQYWWAAAGNKFFTVLVAPVTPDGGEGDYLAQVQAVDLDGVPETTDDASLRLITAARKLPPGGTTEYPLACYLGPLDHETFINPDHADYVRRGYQLLITRSYAWCTFGWLTELMMWLLETLAHLPPYNYGVAVIILVLMVRTLLHPLTKKGQVNMMKMQKQMGKLAPKLEELKKKHANDRQRLNQEMQKLYQAEGINPAGQIFTCMPMMLQMPIWVALYTGLSNNISMRHEPFCLWIRDLTAPDRLIDFGTSIHLPLLGAMTGPISSLNILPILWAVSMYVQQKLTPKPERPKGQSSAQADQAAQMQKMMPIMSIFFALLFYNAPSGLTLYIMASTVFGIIEQMRIRKHIKEVEERGGLEPGGAAAKPRGPRGPLWWQNLKDHAASRVKELQRQADEAQKLGGKR